MDDKMIEVPRELLERLQRCADFLRLDGMAEVADQTEALLRAPAKEAESCKRHEVPEWLDGFEQEARKHADVDPFHHDALRLAALLREAVQPADEELRRDAEQTSAARDVLAERQRQISAEGWTPEHDDEHACGEIAAAAGCYALQAACGRWHRFPLGMWPWDDLWWKPTTARRDLVKAGALILAEIERLDRAALAAEKREAE